jgi:hypothetical protein
VLAGNVGLHDIIVQSPLLLDGSCTIPLLVPGEQSVDCVTSVELTADNFMQTYIFIPGNASASAVEAAPAVEFNTSVDLHVTRSVAVEVKPLFKLPSKPHACSPYAQRPPSFLHRPVCCTCSYIH